MTYQTIFETLWNDYIQIAPSAKTIYKLFSKKGENIENDHIAFRTFNHESMDIDKLSAPFIEAGYVEKGQYEFEVKRLFAKHFEHQTDKNAPKVFISELKVEEFSDFLQNTVNQCIEKFPPDLQGTKLLTAGNVWGMPSYNTYEKLREESEYAAWLYVYGFRTNHFTININELQHFDSVQAVNQFLKDNGFTMNSSGGEVKGTPKQLLEQSSIMAEIIPVGFQEGTYKIPSCYYEFAKRYPDSNGNLYQGFIAKSADKIFESTNYYNAKK